MRIKERPKFLGGVINSIPFARDAEKSARQTLVYNEEYLMKLFLQLLIGFHVQMRARFGVIVRVEWRFEYMEWEVFS